MEFSRRLVDTALETPAPEYIVFRHALAGPAVRLVAVLIDQAVLFAAMAVVFVMLAVAFGVSAVSGFESGSAIFLFLLILAIFLFNWAYFLLLEWFSRGRTVGKMALGLRVVSLDGAALHFSQVAVRNLLRAADMMPVYLVAGGFQLMPIYAVGALSMILNFRTFQRLGDLAAGTIVIRDRRRSIARNAVAVDPEVEALSEKLHPRILPSPGLAQALNDFALRLPQLHPERAREIAATAAPELRRIFGGSHLDSDPVTLLLAAQSRLFRLSREDSVALQRSRPTGGAARNGIQ